jgi:hypothetical protein
MVETHLVRLERQILAAAAAVQAATDRLAQAAQG